MLLATANYAAAEDDAVRPDPTPAPMFTSAPTPVPSLPATRRFLYGGDIRAYELYRTNGVQNASNPNRQAFNFGGSLHGEYHFSASPLYLSATYSGAYPFGLTGGQPQRNDAVDNTLPGFALNTFDEAFVGYSNGFVQAKVGNQIINTPWANAADSRIKPAAFQGASLAVNFAPGWTVMVDDMIRFESRTSSTFGRYTLLTAPIPGATNPLVPSTSEQDTSGFGMAGLSYQSGERFALEVFDYTFDGLANMMYAQGLYNVAPRTALRPYLGLQYVKETDRAPAYIGKIKNQTVGLQVGGTVARDLSFAAGMDYAPWNSATVPLSSCSGVNYTKTGYFMPSGGTPDCVENGNGTVTVSYGGIASPYTNGYSSDPLYTTSVTQGMVDRASAGTSEKLGATYQPFRKQLRLIASQAWYNYVNPAGGNLTRIFNADATYFFNPVKSGPYHGFSLRYRYEERTQPTLPFDFKYNRAQAEYDF